MEFLNKIKSLFNKGDKETKKSDEKWRPAYESDYEGFIGHFNLDEWWENEFSDEERKKIISKENKYKDTYSHYTDSTPPDFLRTLAGFFINSDDLNIAIKLHNKADEIKGYKEDYHLYSSLIKELYKKRNEDEKYVDLCIKYCKKDIQTYEERLRYLPEFKDTRIPAFQRLAIIYEKRKEYRKAIKICEKAMRYNMREKNKDSFEDRLIRLENKFK